MTEADRKQTREMLEDVVKSLKSEMVGKFNVTHVQLMRIEEQTTKHNGRMDKIENNQSIMHEEIHGLRLYNESHLNTCPRISEIDKILKVIEENETKNEKTAKWIRLVFDNPKQAWIILLIAFSLSTSTMGFGINYIFGNNLIQKVMVEQKRVDKQLQEATKEQEIRDTKQIKDIER